MKNISRTLFWTDTILHLLSIIFELDLLRLITKPLLMVFLGLYLYYSVPMNRFTQLMLIGVAFSMIGDTMLMFEAKPIYFVIGLGAFLIAHVFYILGMSVFPRFKEGLLMKHFWLAIPMVAYSTFLLYFLLPALGDMTVPVVIYSIVIFLMGLSAINMFRRTSPEAAQLLMFGALLFILSDSVIAINKFRYEALEIPFPSLVIMFTYILGQFLIVESVRTKSSEL